MRRYRQRTRLCLLAAAAATLAVVFVPSSGAAPPSTTVDRITYRIVFTGSGHSTSAYPPAASGSTVFSTAIAWTLVFSAHFDVPGGGTELTPATESSIEGTATGVAGPNGDAIERGCEQITLGLDAAQNGGVVSAGPKKTAQLELSVPGFDDGSLLADDPVQCSSPFPTGTGGVGCPDPTEFGTPSVQIDTTRALQAWKLAGHCDVPDQGQSAAWTGSLTATRTSPPPGNQFTGRTSQTCSDWDATCRHGARLPISFEVRNNRVINLRTQDEGQCNLRHHSNDGIRPSVAARLDSRGKFRISVTTQHGAYHAEVAGTVKGDHATGTLSSAERFNVTTERLDPKGTILCRTRNVHWTATRGA